ncbi:MAG: glycoside hydrolase domain-containing protein [Streptosporangiaceae bacterium]
MISRRWFVRTTVATASATLIVIGLGGVAVANPATAARYPSGASATSYTGPAFDTCTAPPLSTMTAWKAAPYRALGIYIGGIDRHCTQPQLTAPWVTAVSAQGWRLIPIYKGLQAPCGTADHKINPAMAGSQGVAAADDAIASASSLGMLSGSAIYNDMEAYPPGNTACRAAVLSFLSSWTSELHRRGYVAGVYAQLYSGAADLAGVYGSASYARPDALWIARYDGSPSLTGWAGIPDSYWAQIQRGKQYRGGHDETYGGVTLNIDSDQFNAPVGTVAYTYTVSSSSGLNARSGPATSYPVTGSYASGAALALSCQAAGQKVATTSVWDKLANGSYVTDYYVSTPSNTGYSAPLPRCAYPFQVTASGGLSEHTGPGNSYAVKGSLATGALAWVTCQRAGSKVGTTSVWDKLTNGRWVTDYYVSSFNKTGYSRPVPRC